MPFEYLFGCVLRSRARSDLEGEKKDHYRFSGFLNSSKNKYSSCIRSGSSSSSSSSNISINTTNRSSGGSGGSNSSRSSSSSVRTNIALKEVEKKNL